jgi:hypothetical protein
VTGLFIYQQPFSCFVFSDLSKATSKRNQQHQPNMLFNALSTVALLLTTITGADALRSNRHHRGLESRHHTAHVPANKRTFTFSANATAGEQIGKRRIEEGAEGIDPSNSTNALEKRAFGGMRATFYAIGMLRSSADSVMIS